MPASPSSEPPVRRRQDPHRGDGDPAKRLRSLPRRTYRFRILGMSLSALPLAAVLLELDAGWAAWTWVVLSCVLWPHVAFRWAIASRDPLKAELRNFVIDSFLAGSWLPMLHFNLLPSAVLATMVTADKIHSGVRGLWLRSLPWFATGLLLAGLATGFAVDFPSSTAVILATAPLLVVHSLAVAQSSYQLVRRVSRQNLQLAELSQRDGLTGLANRRHWEEGALALATTQRADHAEATLMLLDADRFKQINDRWGHGLGDEVLRAIAVAIDRVLPEGCVAGRLGGDEFVVALPLPVDQAREVADALRVEIAGRRFDRAPELRVSTSIGLAAAPAGEPALREWLEAADRALYAAKSAGRDRAEVAAPQASLED
ncbi:hypothetical protein P873_01490 [Arenimonas composti TR7-09 = DSM 18010]|uniref:diguanylate cyclase n=2 Tax=Arenimonas TaxID=490567 RepID=A0A091B9S7_9GAMM|nr:hypothetical protein P873_01490 [Arenimonas composti TR7-09 = DSM 18010]